MKTYFADANIFLRFILKDDKKLAAKSRYYFTQAKNGIKRGLLEQNPNVYAIVSCDSHSITFSDFFLALSIIS